MSNSNNHLKQRTMKTEELLQELHKLEEEKKNLMRENQQRIAEIDDREQEMLAEIEHHKRHYAMRINEERRACDAKIRKARLEEKIRWQMAKMDLENRRQQMFIDYKAQVREANMETAKADSYGKED